MPEPLLGRKDDKRALTRLKSSALVSVVGPGGAGKSALVAELAAERDWPVCHLEPTDVDGSVLLSLAQLLEIGSAEVGDDELIERVATACVERTVPVVIDGADASVDDVRETLARLLERRPRARFVVTSREPLGLTHEHVHRLGPLELDDAERLFERSARRVRPDFSLRGADARLAKEIIEAVDRLPLAISLAASRVQLLELQEIRQRMDEQLTLLRSAERDRPPRHLSLRACAEASWRDLTDEEQATLEQCAALGGAFDTEMAESVVALPQGAPSVLELLERLESKSLLRLEAAAPLGGRRLRLYEAVRQLAAEHAAARGQAERDGVLDRLLAWAVPECARLRELAWRQQGGEARARLRALAPNLQAAFAHAREVSGAGAAEIALALWELYVVHGPIPTGISMLEDAAERAHAEGALVLCAMCRVRRARLLRFAARRSEAEEDLQRARDLAAAADDDSFVAPELLAIVEQSRLHVASRDLEAARTLLDGAEDRARASDDPLLLINVLNALAAVALWADELDEAERAFTEALLIARAEGSTTWGPALLVNLGVLHMRRGELANARAYLLEARAAALKSKGTARLPVACGSLALIALAEGDVKEGTAFAEEGLEYARRLGEGVFVAHLNATLGMAEALAAQAEQGASRLDDAARVLEATGDKITAGYYLGFAAVAHARAGNQSAALKTLALCDATVADGPRHSAHEWFEVVALALRDELDEAHTRLGGLQPRVPLEHIAARLVERLLATTDTARLVVSEGGARFRLGADEVVDLSRRTAPRQIFWRLVEARRGREEALTVDALFSAGWPGEKALEAARKNRVYVALSTLRKLGLTRWLVKREDGYRFEDELELEIGEP
jgi:predicted ATPase